MLWEQKEGIWRFTPNPKYYIMIRELKPDREGPKYLIEIWKNKDWYEEPVFFIGYRNTMEKVNKRIQYVLTNQYADLRTGWDYEID